MSVQFDRSASEAIAATDATGSALAVSTLPVSVTCWVYFDAAPGQNETHTVWWWGEDGADDQFVKLAVLADLQGAIKFQATFQASNNTATATATLRPGGAGPERRT